MKFLSVTAALLSSLVALAAGDPTPKLFDLRSSTHGLSGLVWNNLMFSGDEVVIGNIKYQTSSEPLLLAGGSSQYGIAFTSFHESPTGWRNLYVFANESKPLAFTRPHSGFVPPGAQTVGFGSWDGHFKLDVGDGKGPRAKWAACKVPKAQAQGTWKIYWEGKKGVLGKDCKRVKLKVGNATECRYPQQVQLLD